VPADLGLLLATALVLVMLTRRPLLALAVPVSLVVYWDFGLAGLGLLWSALLLRGCARRRSPGDTASFDLPRWRGQP
jgi:hypothetical protein